MQLEEVVKKLALIGEHAFIRVYRDGSGVLDHDFTCKTHETELAFQNIPHLKQILDKVNNSKAQNQTAHTQE